ncbi:MAG: helix-turn-helix domain-containing protein [Simplicispira sp.]|nr:helix-turn-helix domain-containing protein [Simplicispira sp.]
MSTPSPLARYHQVLLAVSKNSAGLTLAELTRDTRLPRSSAHRIASSLCGVGYLETDAAGSYHLGPAFKDLLRRSLTADNRTKAFQPALQFLAAELKETAFFARFVNGAVTLVHAVTPTQTERSYIHPGTGERPLDTCSSSKAILAYADQQLVENMYQAGSLPFEGNQTLRSFLTTLRKVSHDGYAVCDGEIDEGAYSLACPVPVGPMLGLFSIGVVGPSSRMKSVGVERLAQVVQAAANMASAHLLEDSAPAA